MDTYKGYEFKNAFVLSVAEMAREAFAEDPDQTIFKVTEGKFSVTIRRNPSGSAGVTVSDRRRYAHARYVADFVRRLKPAYSFESMVNAIGRCMVDACIEADLRGKREHLYQDIQDALFNTLSRCDLGEIGNELVKDGYEICYKFMDERDLDEIRKRLLTDRE